MSTVIKAVNRAYDRVETRPFWKTRLIAIVLVVLTGLVLAGPAAADRLRRPARHGDRRQGRTSAARSSSSGRSSAGRSPSSRSCSSSGSSTTWRRTSTSAAGSGSPPGRSSGACCWLALSGLFALYTSLSDSYSKTYGALASGIVLLLWLNYSAFALLFGARAELGARPPGRDPRGGRRERRPDQAEPPGLGDPTEPLTVFGLRRRRSGAPRPRA